MTTTSPAGSHREARIRVALGVPRGPLPEVRNEWLRRYFAYLAARLSLPFRAEYAEDIAGYQQLVSVVTVVVLVDPDSNPRCEDVGLTCRALRGEQQIELPFADLEVREDNPNSELIEDYWYWFWNWRFDPRI